MKLKTIREAYYGATGTLSELIRNISFAGIASIWILRGEPAESIKVLPPDLVLPLMIFLLALFLDFLQYVYRSLIWGLYGWLQERKFADKGDETEVNDPPQAINWLNNLLIVAKCASLATACVYLACAAFQRLHG